MANVTANVRHIQRNDTKANWESVNPILSKGEIGVETDTLKFKIGDGVKTYANLEYCTLTIQEINSLLSTKVDKVSGKQLSTNDYTTVEKNKLSSIANNANNYTHPSTHDASMVTESASKRFVSDTEKSVWNGKANASHTHTKSQITDFPTSLPANGGVAESATYLTPIGLTSGDLNSIVKFGTYYAGGSNTVANKPSNVDAFGMQVFKSASGWYTQVLYASNNQEKMYIRYASTTTAWGAWAVMYTSANKPTKSDIGLSNTENKSSATIRGEITKANIESKLVGEISSHSHATISVNSVAPTSNEQIWYKIID